MTRMGRGVKGPIAIKDCGKDDGATQSYKPSLPVGSMMNSHTKHSGTCRHVNFWAIKEASHLSPFARVRDLQMEVKPPCVPPSSLQTHHSYGSSGEPGSRWLLERSRTFLTF